MSLDVYLCKKTKCPKCSFEFPGGEQVYWANITHNLGKMAKQAGIYKALWHPECLKINKAGDIVGLLQKGLEKLRGNPQHYEQFNAPNGWGMYEHFVPFVEEYLQACIENPNATIKTSV